MSRPTICATCWRSRAWSSCWLGRSNRHCSSAYRTGALRGRRWEELNDAQLHQVLSGGVRAEPRHDVHRSDGTDPAGRRRRGVGSADDTTCVRCADNDRRVRSDRVNAGALPAMAQSAGPGGRRCADDPSRLVPEAMPVFVPVQVMPTRRWRCRHLNQPWSQSMPRTPGWRSRCRTAPASGWALTWAWPACTVSWPRCASDRCNC